MTSFWSTVSYLLWRGTRSLFFNQVMDRTNVTTYDDDDPFFFLNLQVISLLYNQPLLNSYQCIFRSHLNSHRLTRRYRKIGNLSGFLFCFLSLLVVVMSLSPGRGAGGRGATTTSRGGGGRGGSPFGGVLGVCSSRRKSRRLKLFIVRNVCCCCYYVNATLCFISESFDVAVACDVRKAVWRRAEAILLVR